MIYKKKFKYIFFGLLFFSLIIVYFPALFYPPVSDYWEIFHFFHSIDQRSGPVKLLHILNRDPCEQMRYQPLSVVFYYILHLIFGSNFIFFNLFNFLFYFLSLICLYKFVLCFWDNKKSALLSAGFFAFLFSHFDIVLWSCHIYIIVGFGMFLLGFIKYIEFLETGKLRLLFLVVLCFLSGMWCYESFVLWPFAIVILLWRRELNTKEKRKEKREVRLSWLLLSVIYVCYFLFYWFTRSINTYPISNYDLSDFLKIKSFISSGFLVLFNSLYNNIIVNIFPFISFPLEVRENIYMAGSILNCIEKGKDLTVYLGGFFWGGVLILFFCYLYKNKRFRELRILGFLVYLMLTELYIKFFCRVSTDNLGYPLTEFRYQYIPNAFIILIGLFVVDNFFSLSKIRKIIISCVFAVILMLNIIAIQRVMNIYSLQLVNLKKILINIKEGINKGQINKNSKLYIPDDIVEYLPSLCWNIVMGEMFMEGTYQWLFPKKEIDSFAFNFDEAAWVIDKENFSVIHKSLSNRTYKKMNSGKAIQYFQLGSLYKDKETYKKAEDCFKKAIEISPNIDIIYSELGDLYIKQEKYDEGEEYFEKVKERTSDINSIYTTLGHIYAVKGRYIQAEEMFRKGITINSEDVWSYIGLGYIYNQQKKYIDAEVMLKRAVALKEKNDILYGELGICYREQKKYKEAEEMFKKAVEINSTNEWAYINLRNIYEIQGRNIEKQEILKK